jgi:hypothetical protein
VTLKATPPRHQRVRLTGASLVTLCLALAACGGGGSSSSTGTTSATSTAGNAAGVHGSSTFATLQACLAKQGIKLQAPTGKPPKGSGTSSGTKPAGPPAGGRGAAGAGAGAGAGGFAKAPSGVSETKYKEALKKCGATNFSPSTHLNSTANRAALAKYEACMAGAGVTLPKANLAGGPIFKISKTETSTATFKAAESKCQSDLKGVLGAGTGAGGAAGGPPAGGPPSGAPPAEAQSAA